MNYTPFVHSCQSTADTSSFYRKFFTYSYILPVFTGFIYSPCTYSFGKKLFFPRKYMSAHGGNAPVRGIKKPGSFVKKLPGGFIYLVLLFFAFQMTNTRQAAETTSTTTRIITWGPSPV